MRADVRDGVVEDFALVLSALAAKPRVVARARELAIGHRPSEIADAVAKAARDACKPLPNVDGDPEWRREAVGVLAARAVARIARA